MRNLVKNFYNQTIVVDNHQSKLEFKSQHKNALRKRRFVRRIKFINSWRRLLIEFS
jgi:hypothetical protein